MVVDLHVVGDQVLAVLDRDARILLVLLELGEFGLRRDPDHRAIAALVQTLGAQDDVQRLVPRHVDQAQGDVALHRVGRDDVEVGFLGDQLQYGANGHVLEVERDRSAAVAAGFGGDLLRGGHHGRRAGACRGVRAAHGLLAGAGHDLHDVLVARLVSQGFEVAARAEHQLRAAGPGLRFDALYGRGEVDHVQRPLQGCRQRGVAHIHDHGVALVAEIGRGALAVEPDDEPAGAILTAPEVDVGDRHSLGRRGGDRSGGGLLARGRGASGAGSRQQADGQSQRADPEGGQAPGRPQAVGVRSGHRVSPNH